MICLLLALIDALELKSLMVKWTITCQLWSVFFVGCLYNVSIRPLIPRSSPHSCAKQKTQGLLRRETHQSDLGPEQGISRSHAFSHWAPRTHWRRTPQDCGFESELLARLWGNQDWRVKFCVYSAVNIFGLAWPTTNLGIVGRWPSTALAKVYPLWPHHLGYLDLGNLDTKRINGVWRGTRSHDDIFPTTKKHQTLYCTAMNIIQHLLISCPFQPSTSKPICLS